MLATDSLFIIIDPLFSMPPIYTKEKWVWKIHEKCSKIMLLVIKSLRGGHTQTHIHVHIQTSTQNNFKKPGAHWPQAGTPGFKRLRIQNSMISLFSQWRISYRLELHATFSLPFTTALLLMYCHWNTYSYQLYS